MKHNPEHGGLDFGHQFHGHEHHFLLTHEALEYLAGGAVADETAAINAYNAHLIRIHAVAERLSRTTHPGDRVVIERSALEG